MVNVLHKLKSLFRFPRERGTRDAAINEILDRCFHRLRNVDPDTHQEWLRLRRALAGSEAEARPQKSRFVPRFALAVTIVVIAIVGGYIYITSRQAPPDSFATGRGERKEVILHDGSQVTLNYATELVVTDLHPGKPRRLSLSGEAYFRVQRNETPFIISTHYAHVQVVGTEFDVSAREGGLEIGVITGMVKVSVVRDGRDSALLLSEHQMALCLPKDFPKRIGNIPSPEYPGWMHGKLFLDGTSFQDACREIEMRFNIAIAVEDRDVHDKSITGMLDAKTAESALKALCELTGKRFRHEGQTYHIY
ncbi:MAG: FecR domain-containing protein [Bacteroidota bacterium]|jgi:ferric-dicitrate binding protein FerR (iron transport regulator)